MKFKKTENELQKNSSWEYTENYRKADLKQCYALFLHENLQIVKYVFSLYVHIVQTMCWSYSARERSKSKELYRMVCCHDEKTDKIHNMIRGEKLKQKTHTTKLSLGKSFNSFNQYTVYWHHLLCLFLCGACMSHTPLKV